MTVFFSPLFEYNPKRYLCFVFNITTETETRYTHTLIIYIPTFEFLQETQGIFALQSQELFEKPEYNFVKLQVACTIFWLHSSRSEADFILHNNFNLLYSQTFSLL